MPLQKFAPQPYAPVYVDYPTLIKAVIAAKGNRTLYLKPHPDQSFEEVTQIMAFQDVKAGVIVSGAPIHSHLAACALVITQNSAVGF